MGDGLDSVEPIEIDVAGVGAPADLVRSGVARLPAYESEDLMPVCAQRLGERSADEAGGSADRDSHELIMPSSGTDPGQRDS